MRGHSAKTDFLRRARARLCRDAPPLPQDARPAAVLVPVVARGEELSVLFTLRRRELSAHAGQISFPGGRMEEKETPLSAALRETQEETGVPPERVEPLGFLDACRTSTGYGIAPLAGLLREGFSLRPSEREVAEIFELPLGFLMDPANHVRERFSSRGGMREYWVMRRGRRVVWGATACILRNLWERLYG